MADNAQSLSEEVDDMASDVHMLAQRVGKKFPRCGNKLLAIERRLMEIAGDIIDEQADDEDD